MAKPATPPAPPWMRIVSPRLSFNVSSIALKAVSPVSAKAAASTCDRLPGLANAEHGVADPQVLDTFADGADHAGKIAPQDIGKFRLLVVADADLPIGAVDAGSDDIDHHLAWRGGRVEKVTVLQDLGPAVSFNESCFHLVPYLHDPQRRVDGSLIVLSSTTCVR